MKGNILLQYFRANHCFFFDYYHTPIDCATWFCSRFILLVLTTNYIKWTVTIWLY